jgi:hypothetical protein
MESYQGPPNLDAAPQLKAHLKRYIRYTPYSIWKSGLVHTKVTETETLCAQEVVDGGVSGVGVSCQVGRWRL